VPLDAPPAGKQQRLGFLEGAVRVPDDFDRMHGDELADEFERAR
jgi:hypothetical protein